VFRVKLEALARTMAIAGIAATGCGSDQPDRARVTFALAQPTPALSKLSLLVHYPTPGNLSHLLVGDACHAGGIETIVFEYNGDGTATVELADTDGFPCNGDGDDNEEGCDLPDDSNEENAAIGGVDLFDCTFDVLGTADDSDFSVDVMSATDVNGQPVVPVPDVVVSEVNTFGNDPTDTDPDVRSFDVTVLVTDAVGLLGALQFNLVHLGDDGGFAGAGHTAACHALIPSALASFNDTGHGLVRAGIIDINGFPTPGAVTTCLFRSREPVGANDFSVELVDATDPELNAKRPRLAVSVEAAQ